MNYLINTVLTYRVPSVTDALNLRASLEKELPGEISSFTYATKYVKEKGEIIEEYQLVKVKVLFNLEKEPESPIACRFEVD